MVADEIAWPQRDLPDDEIVELYQAGFTSVEIAEHFDTNPSMIMKRVHRAGVPTRRRGAPLEAVPEPEPEPEPEPVDDDELVVINVAEAVTMLRSGRFLEEVAEHFDADPESFREALAGGGVAVEVELARGRAELARGALEAERLRRFMEERRGREERAAREERARAEAARRAQERRVALEAARRQAERERLARYLEHQARIRDVAAAWYAEVDYERRERRQLSAWLREHGDILTG